MLRIEIMSEMVITLAYGAPAKQDKTASGNPHSGSRRTRARCTRGTVNQNSGAGTNGCHTLSETGYYEQLNIFRAPTGWCM